MIRGYPQFRKPSYGDAHRPTSFRGVEATKKCCVLWGSACEKELEWEPTKLTNTGCVRSIIRWSRTTLSLYGSCLFRRHDVSKHV